MSSTDDASRIARPSAALARVIDRNWWHAHRSDVLGIAWVVLFAILFLSPSLKDGASFGPTDLGNGLSVLTNHATVGPNHNIINGDIIDQDVPWSTLNWHEVHSGELPLWNPYSGTGLPQFVNFESAPFALPSLVSYAFPLRMSYLVVMLMKLLIAGIGAYFFARVLGVRALAASFAGTTYMLCGAFSGWLGWAVSGPQAWVGFIGAFLVLVYRHRGRAGPIIGLALSVAFSVYGGFPESEILVVGALVVLLLATGAMTAFNRRAITAIDLYGVMRIGVGSIGGLLLSAPLLLPGISVIHESARQSKVTANGIPLHTLLLSFASGYDGLPIKGSAFFGPLDYYETAAYVGVVAIVLGLLAVVVQFRRPAVFGLVVAGLFSLAVVYDLGSSAPAQRLIKHVGLGSVALQRMLPLTGFVVATLGAIGVEICASRLREKNVAVTLSAATALVAIVLVAMWAKVGSAHFLPADQLVTTSAAALRRSSLLWPTAGIVVIGVFAVFAAVARHRQISARAVSAALLVLLGVQSVSLLFAGVGLNSYSHSPYPVTPAVATLQRIVGTKMVGLDGPNVQCGPTTPAACGIRQWEGLGLYPEMNLAYGIDELALHDPVIPATYFSTWPVPNAGQVFAGNLNVFVPAITTAALARRYGVSFVIIPSGTKIPNGMKKVAELVAPVKGKGEVDLYSVQSSGQFSFPPTSGANVLSAVRTGDRSYRVDVDVKKAATIILRVTHVAGWHLKANGKPLALTVTDGVFFSAVVPAGTTTLTLSYWPHDLDLGLVLALLAVLGLAGLAGWNFRRRKATENRQ